MKIALAFALLAMAPEWCRAQDTLADGLRKGIVEEDANHNLAAAIQNYQAVVSRFEEERRTAATALFRLAECYRKLGRSQEANAAYGRVVAQFADQTALVDKSRKQLGEPVVSRPPRSTPEAPGAPGTQAAEARRRYRDALQEKVVLAMQKLSEVNRQLQLGTAGPSDGTDAAMAYLHAQRQMHEFEAGLSGPGAGGVSSPSARLRAKELLEQEIDLAKKAFAEEQNKALMGHGSTEDSRRRRAAVLTLEQELAVLEAMLADGVKKR